MSLKIFCIFATIGLIFLLIYGFPVIVQIYKNFPLSSTTKPLNTHWTVVEKNDEDYRVKVHYQYEVNGKTYENDEELQGESFKTPYRAESSLKNMDATYNTVWYSSVYPEYSSIEKYFPMKRAIYSGILFLLLSYAVIGVSAYLKAK